MFMYMFSTWVVCLNDKHSIFPKTLPVILLQIVTCMVSPWTNLVKNHESQSRTNSEPMSPSLKMGSELKMLGPLCNQIVNLKTDSKTLYYSILKLVHLF